MSKIAILAGEPSGDNLGASLIQALGKKLDIIGVGGEKMQATGRFNSLFPMQEISLMGFVEVIPQIPNLLTRINQTVEYLLRQKPDIVVTIDSPGFNFRVASKLKDARFKGKLVHYVAPTVWAYNEKRAVKYARVYDKILTILPFEPPYFSKYGLDAEFVGHQVTEISERKKQNKDFVEPTICLMPGSRKGEIQRMLPVFLDTIAILQDKFGKVKLLIPTIDSVKEMIEDKLNYYDFDYSISSSKELRQQYFKESDFGIIKSGTSSLEAAMHGLPHIVGYKINPISYFFIKRLVKVKYVDLTNIILDQYIVPEFIQHQFEAEQMAEKVYKILFDKNLLERQLEAFAQTRQVLQANTKKPAVNAANAIVSMLK